jgi:hypothetical protein
MNGRAKSQKGLCFLVVFQTNSQSKDSYFWRLQPEMVVLNGPRNQQVQFRRTLNKGQDCIPPPSTPLFGSLYSTAE